MNPVTSNSSQDQDEYEDEDSDDDDDDMYLEPGEPYGAFLAPVEDPYERSERVRQANRELLTTAPRTRRPPARVLIKEENNEYFKARPWNAESGDTIDSSERPVPIPAKTQPQSQGPQPTTPVKVQPQSQGPQPQPSTPAKAQPQPSPSVTASQSTSHTSKPGGGK